MEFQKLGDTIFTPQIEGSPLANKVDIEFNYYLSVKIHGNNVEMDLTTILFDTTTEYTCKSCYRITIDQIEDCIKANLVSHMLRLGVKRKNIPISLLQ